MSRERYYKYFAFISYSRRDEKFAQRLQKFLMGYKLPTRLCKQYPDRPKNLRPIYRDKTDLGVDNLNKGLSGGLELSKYLIVVCSVNSAQPNREGKNWINEEVRTFVGLEEGNADRVIPVMLRQKGDGSTSKDCTPEAVQELHLLAADVSDKGEERAFSDVAAKMLDLAPNDLWDWWGREQRKKRILRRTLGGIAAAVVLGIVAGLWYAGVPHYKYYRDYVEYNNLPHGIGELSETERAETYSCYRFTWQYLRLSKVECVDVAGKVMDQGSSEYLPARQGKPLVISMDEEMKAGDGIVENVRKTLRNLFMLGNEVRQQVWCSQEGVPVRSVEFSRVREGKGVDGNDGTIQFRERNGGRVGFAGRSQLVDDLLRSVNLQKMSEKARVEGMLVWRNKAGAIVKEVYSNAYGFPVMDADGVWGHLYEWQEIAGENRVVAVTNLARDENDRMVEAPSFSGILQTRYEYDEHGRIISESYLGEDGIKMVCNEEGVAQKKYDWIGNNVERETYYDEEGNRTFCRDGYSGVKREYLHGQLVSICCVGLKDDELCMHKRWHMAICRIDHIDHSPSGDEIMLSYFGTKGEPVRSYLGYSKVRRSYSFEKGCMKVKEEFYDEKGDRCKNRYGQYIEVTEIKGGRMRRLETCGMDGKKDNCNEGFAVLQIDYDGENIKSLCYYGKKEETEKVMNNKYGVAELRFKYSKYGVKEREALDTNGERCMRKEGFCIERIKYDAEGNRTEVSYYDDHDKPCRIRLGENYFHIVRYYYVDGRLKKEVFLNERCETDLDSITEREYEYDDRGREKFITITYVDGTGKITRSRQVRERNSLRQVTHITYVDAVGHPCKGPEGVVCIESDYDENGNEAMCQYKDENGQLCADGNGIAKIVFRTDASTGLQIREIYDMQRRLIVVQKLKDGKIVEEYDNRTGVTNKIEYGADGYRTRRCAYDKEGQLQFRALYGTRDRISSFFAYDPATGQRKEEYRNDKGETMEQKVISRDGNVLQRTVFSGGRRDYSEGYDPATGQRMKVRYDADGKPAELVVTAKNGEVFQHGVYFDGKKEWVSIVSSTTGKSQVIYYNLRGNPVFQKECNKQGRMLVGYWMEYTDDGKKFKQVKWDVTTGVLTVIRYDQQEREVENLSYRVGPAVNNNSRSPM